MLDYCWALLGSSSQCYLWNRLKFVVVLGLKQQEGTKAKMALMRWAPGLILYLGCQEVSFGSF